jgi:HlyD family secretion protein
MPEQAHGLFRREAIEHLSSPERLDELVVIVRPRDWMMLSAIAIVIAAALIWSIWGAIPTAVSGSGILVVPGRIFPVQAAAGGRVTSVHVRAGDRVQRRTLLATIDQSETARQLQRNRLRLAELKAQDARNSALEKQRLDIELQGLQIERASLEVQRKQDLTALADARALATVLEQRLGTQRDLRAQGLAPQVSDVLVNAEQAVLANRARITEIETELSNMNVRRQQTDSRRDRLIQEQLGSSTARRNVIKELESEISVIEAQLAKSGDILSGYDGHVLELIVAPGQVIPPGARIASVEQEGRGGDLVAVMYFPVSDGKRIVPGMPIQITPDIVKRERFGGIIGRVRYVSRFPVTRDATASTIGASEIAERLLAGAPKIQVIADLVADRSTPSGYRWSSSRGPAVQVSPGTTLVGRVTVEERAPITYLLPFGRSAIGLD